jgi:hypothetical protein
MKLIIITLLIVGTAYAEDIRKKAPDRQTKDAIPPVSIKEWKDRKYETIKVKPIPTVLEILKK